MKLTMFVLICLCLVQSLYALVLHRASGALVPEETPEVIAARQLHLSALQAAEEETARQGNTIHGGVNGGNNNFGRR